MTAAEPLHAVPDYEDDDLVDIDFDEAWAERKAAEKPPRIRVFGKIYALPNTLPAKVILFAVNAKRTGRDAASKVDPGEAFDLMTALIGRDNLTAIMDDGLELDDMTDLLERCQEIYKRRQGNRPAPAVTTGAEGDASSS